MLGQVYSFVVSFVANFAFAVAAILVFFAISRREWNRGPRRFFGIKNTSKGTVDIFLSAIWVKPGGTLAVNPIGNGFSGYALTEAEYTSALELATSIETRLPSKVLSRFQSRFTARDIEPATVCKVQPALGYVVSSDDPPGIRKPSADAEHILREPGTMVCIGAPVYNSMTDHILEQADHVESHVEFLRVPVDDGDYERGIRVLKFHPGGRPRDFIRQTESTADGLVHVEYLVVQKIREWRANGKMVFVCAGTSTAATAKAAELLGKWKMFRGNFADSSFAVVYELRVNAREPLPGSRQSDIVDNPCVVQWATAEPKPGVPLS